MPKRISLEHHETVVSVLREAAAVNADAEAYVEPAGRTPRRSLTFAEWDRAADGVAGHLSRRGVSKGDLVCIMLPSSIDYAVVYAGLLRLGAIASGINPRMGPPEVASIIDRASPVLIVADEDVPRAAGAVPVVLRAEVAPLGGPRERSSTTPTSPRWHGAPMCSVSRVTEGCPPFRSPMSAT